MSHKVYPMADQRRTDVAKEQYQTRYRQSLDDPDAFWAEEAKRYVSWFSPWQAVKQGNFGQGDVQWFVGATLNVSYNCLDRHLPDRADHIALIWEGDDPHETASFTYRALYEAVCRFANVLKQQGVKKGDRVCLYLPMIPEVIIAMLACTRIGAVHSVVFGGFSSAALATRIIDADCRLVVTADEGMRGGKVTPLKKNVEVALKECAGVTAVIVVRQTGGAIPWQAGRDLWYHDVVTEVAAVCAPEPMAATDPLFILYTSGSTGKPKGILHTTGGYLVYVAMTHQLIFDYHPGDIYWCTADVGWITGHSYLVYGPLCNGATTVVFAGVPHYPDYSRYWQVIDKHQVNIFYTAPTAIRALRHEGDAWVTASSRRSLKLLGTVGEPINPDVWEWYYQVVGEGRCPIVDTWWQTETGGILISSFPGATPLKPGAAAWPFFGIAPAIVDTAGQRVASPQHGQLTITAPWPGMMSTIYQDHARFIQQYFTAVPGQYLTGDTAYCDADGYYWILGRQDDVIKISGHRIGTEEVESALLTHPAVSEAAVVPIPHAIKGQAIYAFVTLQKSITPSEDLKIVLMHTVRQVIGPIATPDVIQWAKALPKTRSGKILRRLLKKIANQDTDDLGDLSTLADPTVIQDLLET